MARRGPIGSEAGRNEARKLTARALNNIGVACILAAFLQQILAFVQQDRTPTLAAMAASLILVAVGVLTFVLARRKAHQLED